MPELPEVETIRIGLSRLLPGLKVKSVEHDWPGSQPGEYVRYSADCPAGCVTNFPRQNMPDILPRKNLSLTQPAQQLATQNTHPASSKSFPNAPADVARFLVGAEIVSVRRRAKVLIIELSSDYSLIIHLKMTGQLVFIGSTPALLRLSNMQGAGEQRTDSYIKYDEGVAEPVTQQIDKSPSGAAGSASRQAGAAHEPERFGAGHPNKDLISELPAKSTRVIIEFEGGSKLYFNDQRKFGWMRLLPSIEVPEIDFFKKVGPEPLEDNFTASKFIERICRRKNSNIKAVLLDQTVIAGVGNIYADESLWSAKIHPATIVSQIPKTKLIALYDGLISVLKLSIEKGGSTDKNYVDAEGKRGSYLSFANVFRREGQPCPRCGTIIEKIRVAGRGTHICPREQKLKVES